MFYITGDTHGDFSRYSLLCRYFRNAVLPANKELYAEIFKQRTYRCAECGAAFTPNSNRQKYCTACGKRIHRKQKTESERRRRSGTLGTEKA